MEEKAAWKRQRTVAQTPDTPESRREKDIVRDLSRMPPKEGALDLYVADGIGAGAGRLHQVRRPRPSLEAPLADPVIEKKVAVANSKKVGFTRAPPVQHSPPPQRSTSPPSPPPREPEAPPTAQSTDFQPPKSANPFEEVLLRSAQRPRPVFSNGNGLPSFQPVEALNLGTASTVDPSDEPDAAPAPIPATTKDEKEVLRKSRGAKGGGSPNKRSPPGKKRLSGPSLTTPPIFTHRRVVGKKHQYAPVIPSPLSKMVKADRSADLSAEGSEEASNGANDSFSPTNGVLAAGGLGPNAASAMSRQREPAPAPAPAFTVSEGEDDEDGAWVPIEAEERPLETVIPAALDEDIPRHPRNMAPLTEDELSIAPRPKVTAPLRRGPITSKPPVRPAKPPTNPPKLVRAIVSNASAKPREKENLPNGAKPPKPVPSPKAAVIPGKVVIGRSSKLVPRPKPGASTTREERNAPAKVAPAKVSRTKPSTVPQR